jgi:hypothetical protein
MYKYLSLLNEIENMIKVVTIHKVRKFLLYAAYLHLIIVIKVLLFVRWLNWKESM